MDARENQEGKSLDELCDKGEISQMDEPRTPRGFEAPVTEAKIMEGWEMRINGT